MDHQKIYFAKTREGAIIPSKRVEDGAFDIYACFEEEYLEIPWSMEDTIENLCVLKKSFQEKVIDINLDGKGEQDEKEVAFDFDRAIEALEKQIPKKPKEQGTDEKTHYKCPECGDECLST